MKLNNRLIGFLKLILAKQFQPNDFILFRKKYLNSMLIGFLICFLPSLVSAQWTGKQITSSTYFSVLRPMSQGVYDQYSDKSFFCFMQENSNPYAVECDHSGGLHTWGTPHRVENLPAASKYNFPTIEILPDRRLVMCYAAPFDTQLHFAISNSPADASSWTVTNVNIGKRMLEYPRIKVDRRGNIYLWFIQQPGVGAHQRWYYYVKSTNAGITWSAPVLAIERELDDPNGMCELYIGYTADEPYRVGQPEKWWFAYTSSSGFQYEGTHNGANNSSNLTNSLGEWGSGGSGFTYRWLYNKTKGTNSAITNATSTTITPSSTMDWDNGDKYGIAYHNIYHSDVYVTAFSPDNGHWYDAANNDLGTVVSRNEMETATARPYVSPTPPSSKTDVGYIPVCTVNDLGYPTIYQNGLFTSWNGAKWVKGSAGPSGDNRNFWFADNSYYMLTNKLQLYRSATTASWTNVFSISLPSAHTYSCYAVPVHEGHSEALINVHESAEAAEGNAYGISWRETKTPAAIVLRTSLPVGKFNQTQSVNAYITDKSYGSRSRIRNATNSVTLTVHSGLAQIERSSKFASNGLADFSVTPTADNQVIVLKASSPGLDSYYLNLYIGTGTIDPIFGLPTNEPKPVVEQQNLISNFIAFPNPMQTSTTIKFSVKGNEMVSLKILNISGKEIAFLIEEQNSKDNYEVVLSTQQYGLISGLYLAKLQVGNSTSTIKLIVK